MFSKKYTEQQLQDKTSIVAMIAKPHVLAVFEIADGIETEVEVDDENVEATG